MNWNFKRRPPPKSYYQTEHLKPLQPKIVQMLCAGKTPTQISEHLNGRDKIGLATSTLNFFLKEHVWGSNFPAEQRHAFAEKLFEEGESEAKIMEKTGLSFQEVSAIREHRRKQFIQEIDKPAGKIESIEVKTKTGTFLHYNKKNYASTLAGMQDFVRKTGEYMYAVQFLQKKGKIREAIRLANSFPKVEREENHFFLLWKNKHVYFVMPEQLEYLHEDDLIAKQTRKIIKTLGMTEESFASYVAERLKEHGSE
ncbi:MAG: hypothetical protein V1847_03235 [Candidatus Diapherotrites archaeon]